jgi:hypothetical protein
VHHAADRLRSVGAEAAPFGRERRARKGHRGRKGHGARGSAGHRPSLDHAVGGIKHLVGADELRPEWEHVFGRLGHVLAADDEASDGTVDHRIGDAGAIGRPGHSGHDDRLGGEPAFGAPGHRLGIDAAFLAIRDEGHLAAIGRPRRHRLVRRRRRQPRDLAAGQRHDPDVVVPAAIRRERQPGAVGRPERLAIVVGPVGDLLQPRAVGVHHPQVPGVAVVALEGQALPVGRPGRQAGVVAVVENPRRRSAGGGVGPDRPKQVDGHGAAVRRQRRRHRRALGQRQPHLTPGRLAQRQHAARGDDHPQ